MQIQLSIGAQHVLDKLEAAGHEAYVVGGCVRDSLLGHPPKDWDITTNADTSAIQIALQGLPMALAGVKYGTVAVRVGEEQLEVTTYRVDGAYLDGRRPSSVRFSGAIADDLARRDLTINAMAYHPVRGLVDCYEGQADLQRGRLCAVGDASQRFLEDGLRILRTLRFAARYGFAVEEKTAQAMRKHKDRLRLVAGERIGQELLPLLCGAHVETVLRAYPDVLGVCIPSIIDAVGFAQASRYHIHDVWEHTIHAIAAVPPEPVLRLSMLFHDLGKPHTQTTDAQGNGHFYRHWEESTRIAQSILPKLGLPKALCTQVYQLVALHDYDLSAARESVCRWLARIGPEQFARLLAIKRADNLAQNPDYSGRCKIAAQAAQILEDVLARGDCYQRDMLALGGAQLREMGLQGKQIGAMLDHLLEQVLCGACENIQTALLHEVAKTAHL